MIRRALPFAVFLSAMGSLSVELAIVRLGAPYVGQSLLPWSAAIASVLIGLTAGHGLGGVVGGEAVGEDRQIGPGLEQVGRDHLAPAVLDLVESLADVVIDHDDRTQVEVEPGHPRILVHHFPDPGDQTSRDRFDRFDVG